MFRNFAIVVGLFVIVLFPNQLFAKTTIIDNNFYNSVLKEYLPLADKENNVARYVCYNVYRVQNNYKKLYKYKTPLLHLVRGPGKIHDDERKTYEEILENAKQGNPFFQITVSGCNAIGYGTEKDERDAKYWMDKSFENGYILGIFFKGRILLSGEKYPDGLELVTKAADMGLGEAQSLLGDFYLQIGYGENKVIEVNYQLAQKYLSAAIEKGDVDAKEIYHMYRSNFKSNASDEPKARSARTTSAVTANVQNTEITQPESVFSPKNRKATATPTKTTTSVETNIPKSVNENTTDSSNGSGYKNVPWNSSYEQVKYTISDLGKLSTDKGYDSAESKTVDREFDFIDNKLVKVHKHFSAFRGHGVEELQETRQQLLKVLVQYYGRPSSVWGKVMGNQKYGNKDLLLLWDLPKGGIIVLYGEVLADGISLNSLDLDYLSPEEYKKKYNKVFVEKQKSNVPYQRLDQEKVEIGL